MPPASYLLASQITTIIAIATLTAWTIPFTRGSLVGQQRKDAYGHTRSVLGLGRHGGTASTARARAVG